MSLRLLSLALVLAGVLSHAEAKEHAAGCAVVTSMVDRLRNSLILAAVHRARGSSLAAYQVLHTNANAFVRERTSAGCGALQRVLRRALERAARAPTAADASLELDLGYTAALALALGGTVPGRDQMALKRLEVPESVMYGADCADVFPLSQRLANGKGTLPERAAGVLNDLRDRPRCPRLRDLLESTPAPQLDAAIDAFLLDEEQGSPSQTNPIARCPELPMILDRLTAIIGVGAPLYNRGDHEGCRRLYSDAAQALTREVIPPLRCPVVRAELGQALAAAAEAPSAGEAAWALRRGFDRIASSVSSEGGGEKN